MNNGVRKVSELYAILVYDEVVFFQAAVSSISRVQLTIERVYKRSRKTKLGDLSEIIHQKLPIFDKNSFIKAQKNSIIF